jgi:neutral ceramidase
MFFVRTACLLGLLCLAAADSSGYGKQRRRTGDKYLIGVGKGDVTGPVVEIGMMGYADLSQTGTGLRQRIHSRAFIIADANKPSDRFVYVTVDLQSGDTAIRDGVLKRLEKLYPGVYGQSNVAVVGTHSHAGPGEHSVSVFWGRI